MVKKFLLTFLSIFILAGSAFALDTPRWTKMPLIVYIPKDNYSQTVTNAFKSWQLSSGGTVRFLYRYSDNMAHMANITVNYTDYLPGTFPYKVNREYTIVQNKRENFDNANFFRMHIFIATKDKNGNKYTNNDLYAITLRAVGEAVGVKLVDSNNAVMSLNLDLNNRKLTSEDIKALNNVYKSGTKYVK